MQYTKQNSTIINITTSALFQFSDTAALLGTWDHNIGKYSGPFTDEVPLGLESKSLLMDLTQGSMFNEKRHVNNPKRGCEKTILRALTEGNERFHSAV